jgi:hypothetical protein
MTYTINTAHWRVPSEERAFDGWLEGSPTPAERTAILVEVAGRRENWTPNSEAWSQLRDVEHFIGQRVRIQFWDPIMFLLEDEGPYPVLADCQGIVLRRRERFLQAYLILDRVEELPNSSGYSPASFLERDGKLGCTLAPIAEVLEIEDGAHPTVHSESRQGIGTDQCSHPSPSEGNHHGHE